MDLAGYVETKGTGISVWGPMGKIQKRRRIGYLGKKMSLLGRESDTEQQWWIRSKWQVELGVALLDSGLCWGSYESQGKMVLPGDSLLLVSSLPWQLTAVLLFKQHFIYLWLKGSREE